MPKNTKRSSKPATTKQVRMLHGLWRKVAPALSNDRSARLDYASAVIDAQINSFSELSKDEAAEIISAMKRQLRREVTSTTTRSRRPAVSHRQPTTDLDDNTHSDTAGGEVFHCCTERQQWKIKQLANYLDWDQAKLDGFLRKKFACKALWALRPQQAHAMIRVLFNIAARRDVKRRLGREHQVSKAEIDAEIPRIKERL